MPIFDEFGGTENFLCNLILWKYFDIKCPLNFKTALLVLHPKQFKMLPVFLDKLNMWLLSLYLCAKAVGLGSAVDGCLHITDGFKVFVFPKHLSGSRAVLETIFVLFQLSSEL